MADSGFMLQGKRKKQHGTCPASEVAPGPERRRHIEPGELVRGETGRGFHRIACDVGNARSVRPQDMKHADCPARHFRDGSWMRL